MAHTLSTRTILFFLIAAAVGITLTACENDNDAEHGEDSIQHEELRFEGERRLSPAEERRETLTDLQSMRIELTAELDAVRMHMNDGSLTEEEREAHRSRAAELAQGLERLDRAILEVNEADDTTWPSLRSGSRQGAEDLRAWMRENGIEG